MSAIVADLHVHTTRSDGSIEPEDIPTVALEHDLVAIAVTDHDRLPAWQRPIEVLEGVICISGIELRVESKRVGRVDLLGYGVRRTDALTDEVRRLQQDRIDRARKMATMLEDTLEIDLELDPSVGIGRPHIAAAVAARTVLDEQDVFDQYIGDDGPCYVPREVPSFARGVQLLREACLLVVLAHPLRYEDVEGALSLVDELDGIEEVYPYDETVDTSELDHFLQTHDVICTGGSDAHDATSVAITGLDHNAFEPVAMSLGITVD